MIPNEAFSEGENERIQVAPWLWVMDNHKWAIVAWEKARLTPQQRFDLVHVDYHWDGINDFRNNSVEISILLSSSTDEIEDRVASERLIQYDSFIAPAILRGYIENISFVCFQGEDEGEKGIDLDVLNAGHSDQYFFSRPSDIPVPRNPLFFDFCLDVFNRSDDWYKSDLWSGEEIEEFLLECKPFVQSAELVTFSISYGYSGEMDDARELAEIVLNQFVEWRD